MFGCKNNEIQRGRMRLPDSELIDNLTDENLEALSELDAMGFMPGPGESLEDYKTRLRLQRDRFAAIAQELKSKGKFEPFDDMKFKREQQIGHDILDEAAAITRKFYNFAIDWVPGFFLSENLGLLWGGCAVSVPEDNFAVFVIRKSFANRRKWFIYRRDELLAHELCHIARAPLHDFRFEEHFAYQTSFSRLRRYIGNCFIYKYDAILFLMPILVLLGAQMLKTFAGFEYPIFPFWILAGLYPAWLLIRNQLARNLIHRAARKLKSFSVASPEAILFRCTEDEITHIAKAVNGSEAWAEFVAEKSQHELRWKIINHRFIVPGAIINEVDDDKTEGTD